MSHGEVQIIYIDSPSSRRGRTLGSFYAGCTTVISSQRACYGESLMVEKLDKLHSSQLMGATIDHPKAD